MGEEGFHIEGQDGLGRISPHPDPPHEGQLRIRQTLQMMAESTLLFLLNNPQIVLVLAFFTKMEELREYTAAVDSQPLTD